MKLIVQIPCHNEAATLPGVVADIPRAIEGVDKVEILVIDDGSTDGTADVARACGVDHVVSSRKNRGLARTFRLGLDSCIQLGADIIVNTDGDNQYPGADIPRLIGPILSGQADIVIGDRQTSRIASFSWMKKLLQRWGTAAVSRLSDVDVPDAVSGFRAFTRDAALNTNFVSSFSYTIETLIQAGRKHYAVESIYFYFGATLVLLGSIPIVRFLIYYLAGQGEGKIQSLIIGAVLITLGGLSLMFGLIADLINFNRQLSEMVLERVRKLEAHALPLERTTDQGEEQEGPRARPPHVTGQGEAGEKPAAE
jgi:glycosyltransferase involved in cell wall biosynthesis